MGVGPSKQKQASRGLSKSPIAKSSNSNIKKEKRRAQQAAKEDWKAAEHIARQVSHGLRAGVDIRGRLASIGWVEREKVYMAFCNLDPEFAPRWPSEASLREFQNVARQVQAERDEWRARENMLAHVMKREGREKLEEGDLDMVFKTPRAALGLEPHAGSSSQGPRVRWADSYTDYRGVRSGSQATQQRPAQVEPRPQFTAHANCEIVAPKPTRRMNVARLETGQYPSREHSTQGRYTLGRNLNRRGFDLEA